MNRDQLEAAIWQALRDASDGLNTRTLVRRLLRLADAYARTEATEAAARRRSLEAALDGTGRRA